MGYAVTENGFLRVLANPAYHSAGLRPATVVPLLRRLCAARGHQFWEDAVSLRDEKVFDLSYVRGHRQLTDVFLLGLAARKGGRLATFDRTIPVKAVAGAARGALHVMEPS